jgi:tRNA U34 5-methylaminomethyl-2-thiouridine-forming methyltransferase MnmC
MCAASAYKIVTLRSGAHSVHSLADHETFHPGIGPVAEAEALYVRQLRLPERVLETADEFVLWDVGLGAAANALTSMRLIREAVATARASKRLRIVSFDHTADALAFALEHRAQLGYFAGHESLVAELLKSGAARLKDPVLEIEWTLTRGDFPSWLRRGKSRETETPPHAILFDPHSPAKNPAMWTAPFFTDLFRRLDPQRPCALATFTRSTMARATLLLGGFFVGVGHPSGLKEETTVAASHRELITELLDARWLERARRSRSAEPLREPVYQQRPLSPEAWEQLQRHPQFSTS